MTEVETCSDRSKWDDYIVENGGHPLQLWGWGEVKAAHGWKVERVFIKKDQATVGAAQLLVKSLPSVFKAFTYIARGPVGGVGNREEVLEVLADYTKETYGGVGLTIEPDWEDVPQIQGWLKSANTILIPRTLILDLIKTEDELLADMTKKTRQYIRKSAIDVEVRRVKGREELERCMDLYKLTAQRAGFPLHNDKYYYDIFEKMSDFSPVFAAYHQDKPVAFLWLAISGETAFELYGGMDDKGQELRANYTLKWQTVQTMKKWGIRRYDFNGLLNDGVSTFKQGFASHETMLAGTYDKPFSPLYFAWSKGLPLAKKIIRTLKR